MAKRGRKGFKESSKRFDELYEKYEKQWDASNKKFGGNMEAKMSKTTFKITYETYYNYDKTNVLRHMVKDQRNVSSAQADAWVKAARKMGFPASQVSRNDIMSNNAAARKFWDAIAAAGGFKKAIYVDGE